MKFRSILMVFLMFFAAVVPSLVIAAGPTLDIGSVNGTAGLQVTVPVTLTNNGASIASVSIDIGYDTTKLSVPMNAANTAPLAATRGAAITVTDENGDPIKNIAQSVPSSGVLRLGVSGNNNTAIGDGVVVNVKFNILSSASGTLTLTNLPGAASPAAVSVAITGASGTITLPTAATAPGAPTVGTATAGNAQATVSFTAPASNGGSAITGYTVTSSPGGKTATGTASPLTVTGLTNGTAYTFTVTATNAVGTSTASAASNSVTPAAAATAPGAPTVGTATAGNAQATVTFAAPSSNGGSSITGYTVTSSPGGNTATGAASPITVTGLSNGTAYTFTVTATNAAGTSTASAASNSVTPASAATAPGAPTVGTATAGNAQATISFTAPASNGGSAITGYTVTSSPGGKTATGTASPLTVTGLTNGTAYTFTVTATNAVGTSSASAASNSVTPATGPTLDIGSVNGTPGQQVTIPITLTNNGASIASLSIDIGYDTTKLSVPMNTANTAPLAATRGAAIAVVDENGDPIKNIAQSIPSTGVLRLGISGNNNTAIGDGVVVNVKFDILSVASGTLTLTNLPGAASPTAVAVAITGANGSITIGTAIVTYSVTYNANGGSAVTAQTVASDGTATTPTAPTKAGSTFGGWYSDSNLTTTFSFSTAIIANTTLYAKWTVNAIDYTVTFSCNGGSAVTAQTVASGGTATTPTAPTKTGSAFGGWYSDSNLTTAFSFSTAITANTTLYAKWTVNAIDYTVTFSSNGGSAVTAQTVASGGTATTPTAPTKTGSTFGGWYSDSALTTAFVFTTPITANTTLYAKWSAITYAVTYNANGATSGTAPANQTKAQGSNLTLATNSGILAKTGFSFAGWNTAADGSGTTYAEGATYSIDAALTLYAKWTITDVTGPTLNLSTLVNGAITNNQTLNVSGTVTDTSGVKNLKVNGVSTNVATDGTFSAAVALVNGTNTVTVIATDNLDNTTTDSRTITLDIDVPTLNVTAPAGNSKQSQTLLTVTGTINETSTVTIALNGGSPQNASVTGTAFSAVINLEENKLNTISITATDLAGNKSNTVVRTVIHDATKPSLAIVQPVADITTGLGSIKITGTVVDNLTAVTVTVSVDGQNVTPAPEVKNSTFSQLITLSAEKTYAVIVTATDEVGNTVSVQRNVIRKQLPNGDLNGDGTVDISDALKALRIAVGLDELTPDLLKVADVAPFNNGVPAPDGLLDIADAVVILQRSVGLLSWP